MIVIHSNVPLLMELRKMKVPEMIEKTEMDELTIKKLRSDKLIGSCRLESLYKMAAVLDVRLDNLFSIIEIEGV